MAIQLYDPDNIDCLPKTLRIYGASDYATMDPQKGKKEPDYSEHGVWGIDKSGHLWAIDWWYKQCETDVSISNFVKLLGTYKPIKWFNEGGIIDKAIGPAIRKAMQDANRICTVEQLPSLDDKAVKLQAFHARATAGMVHFPIRRAWADHVIDTLVKFPGGRWDDAADVCGLVGRGIDQMFDARPPVAERKPLLIPFTGKWLEWGSNDEKPRVRFF